MRPNAFCLPRSISFAVLAMALLTAGSVRVSAQSTSSVQGSITDPLNAVVPEAVVTLTSPATGVSRRVLSSGTGVYQFLQVAPGEYSLSVEKMGFSTATMEHVTLQVSVPATLDVKLAVGATGQVVNVEAETEIIHTTDASIGNAFTERQVRQLPLDTRNVVQLLSLQPGVTPTGEVLGARRDQNNVTLDGVDVNDNQNSGIGGGDQDGQGSNANDANPVAGFNSVLPVPLDSVQEFRVTVGGQGADLGRSSGGQVALITKSGTNRLHGSAYEYNRNTYFAANSWFNNRSGVDRQTLNRNQFGASLGGPIKKDRAFFFFNYERRIDASALAQQRKVPSETLKQGILTFEASDGSIQTLTPAEIRLVDPLHIGVNAGIQQLLKQYPAGNDPAYGADGGLNWSGYRFNATNRLDNRAYVAKMDFVLDSAAKHTVSLRGTLGNASQDQPNALAQFPGGSGSKLLNNSKGLSVNYTAVLSPTLVNTFSFGFTRQGLAQSGTVGDEFFYANTDVLDTIQNYQPNARANGRILPVYNITDSLTWTKGKHAITTGMNLRVMNNNRFSYSQSFPSYGFAVTGVLGLGDDITHSLSEYLQQRSGNPKLELAAPDPNASAMGALLGLLSETSITYQYLRDGSVLPQGQPQGRSFAMREYEGFINDTYRVTPSLTLTMGLRYSNGRPPYERNGLQVAPTIGLDQFFAERNYLQTQGVPGNAMPNAALSYVLSGPGNGKPSWYAPDNNNFSPRFGLAFSPHDRDSLAGKVFGNNGVFRLGGALMFDRFGSELITQFDQFGSFGLATSLGNPTSYNFTTSPRYNGVPATQPAAPSGGFPFTPPDVAAIAGSFQGINPNLRTPYSFVLNASMAREIPGKMILEVSYVGRLSRKLLLQGDIFTPLERYKDPKSGVNWLQSMGAFRAQNDAGLNPDDVKKNPTLVANNPFVENLFPALANQYFPGSASANYYYGVYNEYGGSYLDMLHILDRVAGDDGKCVVATGCYTFFARQGSSNPTWMNAGAASYHGMAMSLRRAYSAGVSFDFNYSLSHSIDNASAAEGSSGQQGASIQSVYDPNAFRGSSDFDIRHLINANVVYELPFGKGKKVLAGANSIVDQIVGGWQVSSIMRFASGLPTVIGGGYVWNTNYWLNSLAIATNPFDSKVGFDDTGTPSLFASTKATENFKEAGPGLVGTRAIVRLASQKNVDFAVAKAFRLPWEGHRIQFRAEAYNAFNLVNFTRPSLRLTSPDTFGQFSSTAPPREMQFALRYEF